MKPERSAKRSRDKAEVVLLRDPQRAALLGPGAHFAKLHRKVAEGRYEAHLFGGERMEIGVAPDVDLELADRCLAEQDVVLVGTLGADVVLFGALRTKERKADEVILEAPRKLVLRAGKSKLELRADGKVRLTGDAVTVDAPAEIRLASAHVEIP